MAKAKGTRSNSNSTLNDMKKMLGNMLNDARETIGMEADVETTFVVDEKKSQENVDKAAEKIEAKIDTELVVDEKKAQKDIENAVEKVEAKAKAYIKADPNQASSEINKVLDSVDANITVDITYRKEKFDEALSLLEEYGELQERIRKGNKDIFPDYDKGKEFSKYVNEKDVRKGKTTKTSVKRSLEDYLDEGTDENFATLAAYVNGLHDTEAAEEIFGKKHADLFKDVTAYINQGQEALEAYSKAQKNFNKARDILIEIDAFKSFGDPQKFKSVLDTGGIEAAINLLVNSFAFKIPKSIEETKESISSVGEFFKTFGSVTNAINQGVVADLDEFVSTYGKLFSKDITGLTEQEINFEFAKDLVNQLDLSEDKLLVIQSLFKDIESISAGGFAEKAVSDQQRSEIVLNNVEKIFEIANGSYIVSEDDVSNAKKILETFEKQQTNANVEEAYQEYGKQLDKELKKNKLKKKELEELYSSGKEYMQSSSALDVWTEALENNTLAYIKNEAVKSKYADLEDSEKKRLIKNFNQQVRDRLFNNGRFDNVSEMSSEEFGKVATEIKGIAHEIEQLGGDSSTAMQNLKKFMDTITITDGVKKEAEVIDEEEKEVRELTQAMSDYIDVRKRVESGDGIFKKQEGYTTDDFWSVIEKTGKYQNTTWEMGLDKDGNHVAVKTIQTDYQGLQEEIKKVTEAIVEQKAKIDEMASEGIPTAAAEDNLGRMGSHLHELNDELQKYYESSEYIPGSFQKEAFEDQLKQAIEIKKNTIEQAKAIKEQQEIKKQGAAIDKAVTKQAVEDAMQYSRIQKENAKERAAALKEANRLRTQESARLKKEAEEIERNQVLTEESTIRKALETRGQVLQEESDIRQELSDRDDAAALVEQYRQADEYAANLLKHDQERQAILDRADADALVEQYRQADEYAQKELEYEKLKAQYKKEGESQATVAQKDAETYSNNLYNEYEATIKRIYDIKLANLKLDESSLKDQVALEKNSKDLADSYNHLSELHKEINANGAYDVEREKELVTYSRELKDNYEYVAKQKTAGLADSLGQDISKYLDKIKQIKDNTKYTEEFRNSFDGLEIKLRQIQDDFSKINLDNLDDSNAVQKLIDKFTDLKGAIDGTLGDKGLSKNKLAANSSLAKLRKSIEDIISLNSNMGRAYKEKFLDIELRVNTAKSNEEVEELKAEIVDLNAEILRVGKTGKSAFQKFKEAISTKNTQFFAQYFSWQDWIRYVRELSQNVISIDSALTELRKVSDATNERLQQSFKKSSDTALELGQSIHHVINVTADWARLGYDVDAAEELARVTALFTTVGDNMSADDASSYLISTLQGFHVAAEDAEDVVDIYNEVANNFAIDTAGIGEALQRSAASFDAANTSLEKSVALITATNTVVQDPSSVGTLWKTMSARIRGAKTELSELGEEEDEFTQTTSKLQGLVKGLTGFDILKEDGQTFKDIYDIVLGIGKEWKNLTDIEQASLGEALAGKRNANALYAVLNNIETLEDAYETASHAEESAAREQENYAKSVQYSLDRFQASIEKISVDLLDSKLIKSIVEGGVSILDILDQIISKLDSLPALLTAAGSAFALFKTGGIGFDLNEKNGNYVSLFGQTLTSSSLFNKKDTEQIKSFMKALDETKDSGLAFQQTMYGASRDAKVFVTNAINAGQSTDEIAASMKKATSAGEGFSTSLKRIGSSLLTIGANIAITATISLLVQVISKLATAEKDLIERTKQLSSEYSSAKEDIDDYKSEMSKLYDVLKDSNSSYEESKAARERLLQIQDELISKYGAEKGAIDDITAAVNGELDALDRLSKAKWQETKNSMDTPEEDDWLSKLSYWWTTNGYEGGVDKAVKQMQSVNTYRINSDEKTYSKYMDTRYLSTQDVKLLQEFADGYKNLSLELNETSGAYYLVGEDMQSFYQDLLSLQEEVKLFGGSDDLNDFLTNTASNTKKVIDSYGSFYDQYIQNEKIIKSSTYSKSLDDITSAVKEYKDAYAKGFETDADQKKAIENLSRIWTNSFASIDDAEVKGYIERLYPEIASVVDSWEFELKFKPGDETRNEIEGALEQFKNANDGYISYESLKGFKESYDANPENFDASDGRVVAYIALKKAADEYEISVEQLIEALKKEKLLLTDDYQKLVKRYGQEAIDSLSAEDLEIALAFADINYSTFDRLVARIEKEKEKMEIPIEIKLDQNAFSTEVNELDALQSAYNSFRENVENKETKINLDISDVDALREKFGELENFDFDEFERVLTSDVILNTDEFASKEAEMQAWFDSALTAYANQKIALEGINEQNKEMIRTQLEMEGVTAESAQRFVDAKLVEAKAAEYSENVEKDFQATLKESARIASLSKDEVKKEMDQLQQGGSVDLSLRPVIDTSELEKAGWGKQGGGIATLFSSTFSNEDNTVAINFTPIMTDENGNYKGTLSPNELQAYAEDVISGVREDDLHLQIGAEFHGEDAIEQAEEAAEEIHKLQAVYYDYEDDQFAEFVKEDTYALLEEAEQLGYSVTALAAYRANKLLAKENPLDTAQDRAQLLAFCQMLEISEEEVVALAQCIELLNSSEIMPKQRRDTILMRIQQIVTEATEKASNIEVDYSPSVKNAAGGGKDAGDAYVEAYEKELQQLNDLKDQGLISEREYLDRLKSLIDKFFKDRAEYAEKYAQEMQKYMDQMLTHYNSVISGVTTLLDRRISDVSKQKDSVISALEAEKEAAEEAYQAQIDALQEEIDALDDLIEAKQEEIDKLNDQIDAINEANDARDRSINLQKAEYELQRQMHQRTKLVYTGEPGQMRYERDEKGMRDAQENLKDAQDAIAIAAIEKQIKLIEDEIEAIEKQKKALEEQQEELRKAMEATSKYYEKLIKQQEKMFDDMIKALEDTKSKWEELAEVDEISKAWGLVSEEMQSLGYTIDDVLNGNEAAFDAFKQRYVSHLAEMHKGDQGYLDGLKNIAGQAPGEYKKLEDAATQAEEPIKKLGDTANTAVGKVSSLGTTASTAATGVGQLKDNSEGIADNLNALNDVQLGGVINGPLTEFEAKLTTLKDLISGPDSLLSAFNTLNTTINIQGVVDAFTSLDEAINAVVSSIGGGGTDEEGTYGGAGKHGKNGMPSNIPASGVEGGTGGGLIGAINSVKTATDTAIGTNAEEEGETATGAFFALKTAVDNVTAAIGMGEEGGEGGIKGMLQNAGGNESGGGEGTLTAAITSIKPTTDTALKGEDGAIAAFEKFKKVLEELVRLANELLSTLRQLSSIKLPTIPGVNFTFTGTAIGGQHYEGTAKLNGDWSVKHGGTSLVGELGQELVVDSKTGKFRTVGDHGPEFVRLNPGDIVFNHLQTAELLSKKNLIIPKKGRSFANGTLPSGFSPWVENSKIDTLKAKIREVGLPTIDGIKAALQAQTDAIRSEVRNVVSNNASSATINQSNTFNISGVSGEDVARQINTTLVNTFSGMSLNAYQRSMA